jgi:cytidyltransferase-like protein
MQKIVIITGGFEPLQLQHLAFIAEASELGDKLIVGLNSDEWLARRSEKPFLTWEDRYAKIRSLDHVDWVIPVDDKDETSKHTIWALRQVFPDARLIFANGGSRTAENTPEVKCDDDNVEFVFGVGDAKD